MGICCQRNFGLTSEDRMQIRFESVVQIGEGIDPNMFSGHLTIHLAEARQQFESAGENSVAYMVAIAAFLSLRAEFTCQEPRPKVNFQCAH